MDPEHKTIKLAQALALPIISWGTFWCEEKLKVGTFSNVTCPFLVDLALVVGAELEDLVDVEGGGGGGGVAHLDAGGGRVGDAWGRRSVVEHLGPYCLKENTEIFL